MHAQERARHSRSAFLEQATHPGFVVSEETSRRNVAAVFARCGRDGCGAPSTVFKSVTSFLIGTTFLSTLRGLKPARNVASTITESFVYIYTYSLISSYHRQKDTHLAGDVLHEQSDERTQLSVYEVQGSTPDRLPDGLPRLVDLTLHGWIEII